MATDASRAHALSTQGFLKQFIEIYKSCPVLWDNTLTDYSNKYLRCQAHDRLLEHLKKVKPDATRGDVVRKINTIRSNYNRVAKQVKSAEAEGRWFVATNWQYHELRFLDAVKKTNSQSKQEKVESDADQNTTESTETEQIEETWVWDEDIGPDEIKVEIQTSTVPTFAEMNEALQEEISTQEETPHRRSLPDRKANEKRHSTLTKHGIHKPNQRINLPSSSMTAGIEPIALVWSTKLQSLRPAQRLFAEKAINDVLFEATLNKLGKGPIIIDAGISGVSMVDSQGVERTEELLEYGSTDEEK